MELEASDDVTISKKVPTGNLQPGPHILGVRTRGETGWSPTTWHEVIIREDADIEYAE